MEFNRSLSASEAKYKYVRLPKSIRDKFPEKDEVFKLLFRDKTYDMVVNNSDCIMLTQLYETYGFTEGDFITITDHEKGVFELFVAS